MDGKIDFSKPRIGERELGMDFRDDRERITFEDRELLPAPRKRGRLSLKARIIVWCVCLTVVAVICVAGGGLASATDKQSGGGKGEFQPPTPPVESSLADGSSEREDAASDGAEESHETESSEKIESGEEEDFVAVDLSFSDKGDGYFYNYSKRVPDVESLLDMGFNGGKGYYSEKPVVLILHTYIREGYYDLNPDSPADALSKSVISVGERIAYDLSCNGVSAIHCTVIHGEGGNGAYSDAAETIRYMREIYPSIEYVIDLRRMDERDEEGRAMRTRSALGTAQIRLTVSSNGEREQENLSLALALRRGLNIGGKALCMPVVYTDAVLNSGIAPYYLRVDVGSSGNLTSEALAAGEYFAEIFADLLKN